ncbi:putative phosphoribosyltransferase [Mesorhizobium soli]|uniref:hypothetical protein n=1 Tax=Pseudaminobacter soli (ex Li et al. 2025) TaxID=1295366 RepID=UPI00247451DC|nr:hypothetical protein [Mesorhizobium soli]MDH6231866.1 putative phosphoribosyltransferase [Mesorhizobium soli]
MTEQISAIVARLRAIARKEEPGETIDVVRLFVQPCRKSIAAAGIGAVVAREPLPRRGQGKELSRKASQVVCISQPAHFLALAYHYLHFPQLTDEEVIDLLRQFRPQGTGSTQ